jgi:ABC-2 type transport system ATP-binding protein
MIIDKGRVVYAESMEAATKSSISGVIAGFRRPPAFDALNAIAGVAGVEALGDGLVRLSPQPEADPREAIAAAAAANGWGLFELRAQIKTLEETFVELTSGDITIHESLKEAA